jgi:hypothetical protein
MHNDGASKKYTLDRSALNGLFTWIFAPQWATQRGMLKWLLKRNQPTKRIHRYAQAPAFFG